MRGIKQALQTAVFVGALTGLCGAAFAQADPKVPVTFMQYVPAEVAGVGKVSQSRIATAPNKKSFFSQVTYSFNLQNNGSSDLNRSFLTATLGNPGGTEFPTLDTLIVVNSLDPTATCKKADGTDGWAPGGSSINCYFGTLPTGVGASVTIYFVVNVPKDGTTIEVDWQGGGFEGNGGSNGCCQPAGAYFTQMVDNQVDQSYKFKLQTFVNKGGAELFTGDSFTTLKTDPSSTYVKIPAIGTTYDTANLNLYVGELNETAISPTGTGADAAACKANKRFTTCFSSDISVKKANFDPTNTIANFGPDQLLDITLRIDSSVIRPNVAIEDVVLSYYDEISLTTKSIGTAQQCVYNADGTLPKANLPCWNKRFEWAPTTPGYTTDLKKDFEWQLKHYKNGTWKIL